MKRVVVALLMGMVVLSGCAGKSKPQKTSLELQAIQARTFEAEKKVAFNSVMSVFQDLGYLIGSASLETGFITAESPNREDSSGKAILASLFVNVRTEQRTAVTASIEEMKPGSTRVRLNFVEKEKRSGYYGQNASDDTPIEVPVVYQNAFEKIGEAIFIRQGTK